MDDAALYVDRNGNGDLTEGALRHTGLELSEVRLRSGYRPKNPEEAALLRLAQRGGDQPLVAVSLTVQRRVTPGGPVKQQAGVDTNGFLRFANRPQEAPVIHFDGPLAMGLLAAQALVRGPKAEELSAWVGTPGRGAGTFASLVYEPIPADLHPLATVEFPAVGDKWRCRSRSVAEGTSSTTPCGSPRELGWAAPRSRCRSPPGRPAGYSRPRLRCR
jgi:hypothetical protein